MAWKKNDDNPILPEPAPLATRPATPPPASLTDSRRADRGTATIGPSIFIKGDLSGDEDLVIEGRVEGRIDLKQHNVTIGKNGRVHADVYGNTVVVEGEVDGNLFAQQQAILRQSGAVRGNITAPRVMLEDGSRFRGSIDMDSKQEAKAGAPNAGGGGATAPAPASGANVAAGTPAPASTGAAGAGSPAALAGAGVRGGSSGS